MICRYTKKRIIEAFEIENKVQQLTIPVILGVLEGKIFIIYTMDQTKPIAKAKHRKNT